MKTGHRITAALAASVVPFALALAVVAPAHAAVAATTSSHASTSDVQVVPVQLALDCTHMSASARQYANVHHYCPTAGTATPDSTGTALGDCGTSFITINDLSHGNAQFIWGFASSMGTVIARSLQVNWLNETFGRFGGWPDVSGMLSASYTSPARTVSTGEGDVFGDVGGSVLLWWGGTCDLLNPSTTQHISS